MLIEFRRINDPDLLRHGQQHSEHVTGPDMFSCPGRSRDRGTVPQVELNSLCGVSLLSLRCEKMCHDRDNRGRASSSQRDGGGNVERMSC